MMSRGVDYHPGFQQIAFVHEETGECGEPQLNHGGGEAERFYREKWILAPSNVVLCGR
jgi:hypothetical protein